MDGTLAGPASRGPKIAGERNSCECREPPMPAPTDIPFTDLAGDPGIDREPRRTSCGRPAPGA